MSKPTDNGVLIEIPLETPKTAPSTLEQTLRLFKKMTENHIMALPIVDHGTGKLTKILTIEDVIAHFLKHFTEADLKAHNIRRLLERQKDLMTEPVSKLKEEMDPCQIVGEDATVYDAARMMAHSGSHRIMVVDSQGRPSNLITQSRVMKLVAVVLDSIPACKKTLQELGLGKKEVVQVNENEQAMIAFRTMLKRNLTALAVVNDQGVLVGNLSVNDIKVIGFDAKYFEFLTNACIDYIRDLRIYDSQRTVPDNKDPLTCKQTDTLAFVINLLTAYRVHRVYVVDDAGKPTGVVSLTDVLKVLLDA